MRELGVMAIFGGMFPGPLGLVAFVGVKFGGYALAAIVLKKIYPGIVAGIAKIAGVRTGLGLVLGIAFWLLSMQFVGDTGLFSSTPLIPYIWLAALRIVIWAVVISIFVPRGQEGMGKFLLFSGLGAIWSCVLDGLGIALALITPGRIPVC